MYQPILAVEFDLKLVVCLHFMGEDKIRTMEPPNVDMFWDPVFCPLLRVCPLSEVLNKALRMTKL